MNTYSKLYSSIGKDSRDKDENKNKNTNVNSLSAAAFVKGKTPSAETKPEAYPDAESFPSSFDPDMDALGLLELRLQNLQLNYMRKIIYWKNQKLNLLAEYALKENIEEANRNTMKETLVRILQEIKALFQFADAHLRDVYKAAAPGILSLEDSLNKSCEKYEELQKDPDRQKLSEEDARLRLDICNQSIDILSGCVSLINDTSREITFCVKVEEIIEKTAVFLMDVLMMVLVPIPIPKFDFNFSLTGLYRNFLFSEVRPEATRVEDLTLESDGVVKHADKLINQNKKTQATQPAEQAKTETIKVQEEKNKANNMQMIVRPKTDKLFQPKLEEKSEVVNFNNAGTPALALSM